MTRRDALGAILTLCAVLFAAQDSSSAPDLILHSGRIVTVDKQFSIMEAIAIKGGKTRQQAQKGIVMEKYKLLPYVTPGTY